MKKFFKILILSMLAAMCFSTLAFAAEGDLITMANAEGDDPYCGYNIKPGVLDIQIVADPQNADNKVYYLKNNTVDKKSWTYIWFNDMNFVPEETYAIEYDVLIETDATGAKVEYPGSHGCFAFSEINPQPGKSTHHGISGKKFDNGKWTHISIVYTVPSNIDTSKPMSFGIYADPGENCGTNMYLDNISVKKFVPGEGDPDTFTVFCIGNSVLQHGPNSSLGWFGNYGMAASAEDKDYYSVMQQMFNADFPEMKNEWFRAAAAGFERGITDSLTADYKTEIMTAFGPKILAAVPDVVTMQFGENTPRANVTAESFAHAVEECIDFCRSVNPDVKIVLSTLAIGSESDIRSQGMKIAGANKGVPVVNLSQHSTPENKAIGLFEHSGVAGHPGDKGMQKIAEEFYPVIKAFALGEEIKYDFSMTVNGTVTKLATEPVVEGDVVYVALEEVCAKLGMVVSYDASYKALCVSYGNISAIVPAEGEYVMLNDSIVKLASPVKYSGATVNSKKLVVPAELFKALGVNVTFDKAMNTLSISK